MSQKKCRFKRGGITIQGFFDKSEVRSVKQSQGPVSCVSCGLYKDCMNAKIPPHGNFKKQIMVIGGSPNKKDDETGIPWQGGQGLLLRRMYARLGIDLFEDCVSLYAVGCWSDQAPSDYSVDCCRGKVLSAIKTYRPKIIILHGDEAVSSLITGYRWQKGQSGIATWRGWVIPDREFQAWVCPTFCPSFLIERAGTEASVICEQDLTQAFSRLHTALPLMKEEQECVTISQDIEGVLNHYKRQTGGLLALDLETTGLKPYNKEDHEIVTISFCNEWDRAHAIPFPTEPKHLRMLREILENPKTGKIAANLKFEDIWLHTLHGIQVAPWVFDTMQAAHIWDNRPGITGLKFQSYIRFGTANYDQEISAYLKSPGANQPNDIKRMVRSPALFNQLLLYNGIDSLLTFRLAQFQVEGMKLKIAGFV